MRTFRLTLEYDGSGFQGWQVQPAGRRTVQGTLEEAVARVTGERVRVVGASRTDAGVHAEGQVASVALASPLEAETLLRALNGVLPRDVAVVAAEERPGFHAIRDARSKLYRYAIWNGTARAPLRDARSWWIPLALDLAAMREAAGHFTGRHDWSSFQAARSGARTTTRTLLALDVLGYARGEIRILVQGEGFLRHMVRVLVGTLAEVGRGRRRPGEMPAVLAARDRRRAGVTAPARGLSLLRVAT